MRRARRKESQKLTVHMNEEIRFPELRVVFPDGKSEVMKKGKAVEAANQLEMDLVLVSDKADIPIAKIVDYGKYVYEQKKKAKEVKSRARTVDIKNIQIKIGTGEGDLNNKADMIDKWLADGDRVKVELFLRGRSKFMPKEFLHEKLNSILHHVEQEYIIVENIKESPKGLALLIETKK